jgi:hypothetical protein
MKTIRSLRMVHPFWVLLMAAVGVILAWLLFQWGYSIPHDPQGNVPAEFWVWLFLIAVFMAILAVFFLPMWALFLSLFKSQVASEQNDRSRLTNLLLLLLSAVTLAFIVMAPNLYRLPLDIDVNQVLPPNHTQRMQLVYLVTFLVVLPIVLGILLVFTAVQKKMAQIQTAQDESRMFEIADELIGYRGILQIFLLAAGIILSLVPINTAALRSTLVALGGGFPIEYVIVYGLFYTFVLVLIYSPTHLAMTEASRALRDRLCPINSLSNITDAVDKRRALDDLLQTNMGLGQNLKAGIATLAPLVTALVASLLGINL